VIRFELPPVLLSDDVSFASNVGLVDEQTSLIKACFESTDYRLAWESHFKMDLFVNFVADVVKAFFDENDFVNVIKLREEEFSLVVVDWLQILENLDHEVLVLKVAP